MRIEFEKKSKTEIRIIGVEGKQKKEIGRIFTPSGSGNNVKDAIQVCGFDTAFDLWGCGIFGQPDGFTEEATPFENVKVEQWKQAKDIQLRYSMKTAPHCVRGVDGKCLRCYNEPCTCEVKYVGSNPYTVKRSSKYDSEVTMKKPEKAKWRCKKCGRTESHQFYEHATSAGKNDFCEGEVVEVKPKGKRK